MSQLTVLIQNLNRPTISRPMRKTPLGHIEKLITKKKLPKKAYLLALVIKPGKPRVSYLLDLDFLFLVFGLLLAHKNALLFKVLFGPTKRPLHSQLYHILSILSM
ncbi:MAG: hypothetical protein K6G36_00430 [Candidatus Saccharibacteria bacterium]|nr:hypothetical protein [Candidatus Saccharibacteria bacterium]